MKHLTQFILLAQPKALKLFLTIFLKRKGKKKHLTETCQNESKHANLGMNLKREENYETSFYIPDYSKYCIF
jgi:hypothetical protein